MTEAILSNPVQAFSTTERAVSPSLGMGPVQPAERIQLLDVLRGFALFGILQVNWGSNYLSDGGLDSALGFFFDSSFKPLFSFLFGLGFAIQLIRADEKHRPIVLRYLWRMILLFLIGAAHYTLIWDGDIAYRYALLAVPLLLFFKWPPVLLIGAAAAVLMFYVAPKTNFNPNGRYWLRPNPELAEAERSELLVSRIIPESSNSARWAQAFAEGGFAERVAASAGQLRIELRRAYHPDFFKDKANIFFMFLIGLYAGRRRILHDPTRHRRLLSGVLVIGLLLGIAGGAHKYFPGWVASIGVELPKIFNWGELGESLGDFGMTFGYISTVTLLFTYRERVRRFLAPLGNVGRMSLTNYIMQGVIMTAITGDGSVFPHGPLQHSLDNGWRILLLAGVFATQILYSRWWFQYFQFGPVEWAWRSLTWFRMQPMRVRAVQPAAA